MDEKNIITRYDQAQTVQQKIMLCLMVFGRSLGYLLLYFCVPALFLSVGYVLFHADMDSREFFVYGGNFYSTLGIVATLYFLHRRAKQREMSLISGLPKVWDRTVAEKIILYFAFGIVTALALSAALTLAGKIPFLGTLLDGYATASSTMYRGYDLAFAVLSTVVFGPLVEEVIFRGYVLDTVLVSFGETASVWIVAVGFALCHLNGLWILYAIAMGFCLGQISLREDGVFYPVICHIGFNLPSAIIYVMGQDSDSGQGLGNNVLFLLFLMLLCSNLALVLVKHYRGQNRDFYQSIWRYRP